MPTLTKKPAADRQGRDRKGLQRGALGARAAPPAPFFRFPTLAHPPEMVTYLGERNIAMFSTDFDSFDFKLKKPDLVIKSVMDKLQKHGKGIVLMHDFQHVTAEAMPELLAPDEGRRLQDRAPEGEGAGADAGGLRRPGA